MSTKKVSQKCMYVLQLQKLFTNFHQIWQMTAAINAEQCVLKCPLHLAWVGYTHYLVKGQ